MKMLEIHFRQLANITQEWYNSGEWNRVTLGKYLCDKTDTSCHRLMSADNNTVFRDVSRDTGELIRVIVE